MKSKAARGAAIAAWVWVFCAGFPWSAAAVDEPPSAPLDTKGLEPGTSASLGESTPKGSAPLSVGDFLFVDVYRHPELSTGAQIDPRGNISLTYVGSIPVAGLSEGEASARVTMEMSKILKSPRVTVSRGSGRPHEGGRTSEMALEIVPLHNANAESLSKTLQGMSSEGGSISADIDTNTLIVTDTPAAIKNIQSAVARLDDMQSQLSQVKIESKIAEVRGGAMKELGIRWFTQGNKANGGYYPMPTQDPGLNAARGQQSSIANEQVGGISTTNGLNSLGRRFVNEPQLDRRMTLPVQIPAVGQLFLGYLNKGVDVGVMIDALVAENKAQLLANPMILTVNHKLADIKMVDEYPYTNLSTDLAGRSNYLTRFMPVGIELSVTPHVLNDEGGAYVKLELEPQVSFTIGSSGGVPIRSVRSSKSVANVRSGQTLVIGGIFSDDMKDTENRVPGLGKIPVIQNFFKHTEKNKVRTELMVFVTPTVYDSPEQVTWEKMIDVDTMAAKDTTAQAPARAEARKD